MSQVVLRLYEIPVGEFSGQDSVTSPTEWDKSVIFPDLQYSVNFLHKLHATPEVTCTRGTLQIKSGLPFIIAAREAVPALTSVICSSASDHKLVEKFGRLVSVSDLLDSEQEDTRPQMVFFDITAPFHKVEKLFVKGLSAVGIPIASVCVLHFSERFAIVWDLGGISPEDNRIRKIEQFLIELSEKYPLTSWNGIKLPQRKKG